MQSMRRRINKVVSDERKEIGTKSRRESVGCSQSEDRMQK